VEKKIFNEYFRPIESEKKKKKDIKNIQLENDIGTKQKMVKIQKD
jgi:hypothetical protein